MDFAHAVLIKVDEIIADMVVDSFNNKGCVRDLLCWQGDNDVEAGDCGVSSYRDDRTVSVSHGVKEGAGDVLRR